MSRFGEAAVDHNHLIHMNPAMNIQLHPQSPKMSTKINTITPKKGINYIKQQIQTLKSCKYENTFKQNQPNPTLATTISNNTPTHPV